MAIRKNEELGLEDRMLAGRGTVQLNGTETGFEGDASTGSSVSALVNAAEHTIQGAGQFNDIALVAVPSPSVMGVLAMGGLVVARRRRG